MSAQHATTTRKADRFATVSDEELLRSALLGVAAGDCGQVGVGEHDLLWPERLGGVGDNGGLVFG